MTEIYPTKVFGLIDCRTRDIIDITAIHLTEKESDIWDWILDDRALAIKIIKRYCALKELKVTLVDEDSNNS